MILIDSFLQISYESHDSVILTIGVNCLPINSVNSNLKLALRPNFNAQCNTSHRAALLNKAVHRYYPSMIQNNCFFFFSKNSKLRIVAFCVTSEVARDLLRSTLRSSFCHCCRPYVVIVFCHPSAHGRLFRLAWFVDQP